MRVAHLLICALLLGGCGWGGPDRPDLQEVTLPDLSRMDQSVQTQIRDRFASLAALRENEETTNRDLGNAYGSLGMLLHAGEYYDAAEPAYRNALALMPDDHRWPYYLAHLHRSEGDTAAAMAAFRRARELRPDDVPTLVWLGRMHLDQGEAAEAETLFARAQSLAPSLVAVQVGLGQAALAQKNYARAVQLLDQALQTDPTVLSIHSPLAMAYRGLGDTAKAEAHLKQWRNTEVPFPDPVRMELDLALESGLSYELRGVRALETQDFATAADYFRKGVAVSAGTTPLGRSLRHKLGTALYLSGDVQGAVRQFEETLRFAPEGSDEAAAKAHYSLGVIAAGSGRTEEAVNHLTAAVRNNPSYLEARLALADILRGAGRHADAMPHYAEAARISPRATAARLGYALSLARLGRYAEARDWLEESVRVQPDAPELSHLLARLLAAAPDARVRDGNRALAITRELSNRGRTTSLGETMAMTVAELGDYREAAEIQRSVLEAARKAGLTRDVRRMEANLRLYEQGRPCRTPFTHEETNLIGLEG